MGGYSELIKNFSKTRDYVRDFFIYGFKARTDFSRKSARTYDDEKRRVESWLGDHLRYDDSVSGRMVSISVDSGHTYTNPLYKAYYSKSFTDNDIRLHFFLIDILSGGEWLSLKEITERLDELFPDPFDIQTVRNKLREYVKEGIFLTEKRGKTSYFRISYDDVKGFINKYNGLEEALRFFSCSQEFGVIGSTLMNAADIENDIFLMKHNYIVHTLEDEIALKLISAIEEKRYTEIQSFGKYDDAPPKIRKAVPLQILSSLQTGRRYAALWDIDSKRFIAARLDFIKDVKITEICSKYDEIYEKYIIASKRSFGVSFNKQNKAEKVEPLKITFTLDENNEKFIIKRLKREKRCGILEKTGAGLYTVIFDVEDPQEIMHWAKSFIGRIVSIEGGTEKVRETFYSDIKRMAEMYGGAK